MAGLPVLLRLAGRPVLLLGEGEAVDAKRRLLTAAGALVVAPGTPAALAVVGPEVPAAAVAALRAAGVLVNAVDRPALCDWTLPAVVRREPLVVAVGTDGVSAGLAAAVRQRLERILPGDLGAVAMALGAARDRLRAAYPAADARRRAIGAMLAEGGPLDPLAPPTDPAAAIAAALAAPEPAGPDRVERVAVRSADPDELTLRAARLLGQADRVFHPADMGVAVLDRARADAVRTVGGAPVPPPPGLSVELEWAQ